MKRVALAMFVAMAGLAVHAHAASAADLAVTKTDSPDPAVAGFNYSYTITVANLSTDAATGVQLTDRLSLGAQAVGFSQSAGTCTFAGTPSGLDCNLGTIPGGGTVTINMGAQASAPGVVTNTATVSSTSVDLNPFNNIDVETTVISPAPPADLRVTKTGSPDPVNVGQNLTYTITLLNASANTATNVTLRDVLLPNTTFVSVGTSTGGIFCAYSATAARVTCFGAIGGNQTVTITLVVTPTAPAALQNTVSVSSSTTPDPDLTNNSATVTTTVVGGAALSVTKTAAPATVTQGGNITYTVTVSNAGPEEAQDVFLTDVLPAGVALITPLPSSCTAIDGTITCHLEVLGVGDNHVYTFVVRTQTAGQKTNTATVTSQTFDPNVADNVVTATTTVTPDLTPPICTVVSLGANRVVVVARDVDTGLLSITPIPPTSNVVVSGNTAFTPGTQAQVMVTGTRVNRSTALVLRLRVTDVGGNSTTCDPVLATLRINRGDRPTVRSYAGIPRIEHKLTIKALRPGLTRAVISVNGQRFVVNLRGKRIARLSIARALTHGRNNTVTVKLYGARGAMALVALTD